MIENAHFVFLDKATMNTLEDLLNKTEKPRTNIRETSSLCLESYKTRNN